MNDFQLFLTVQVCIIAIWTGKYKMHGYNIINFSINLSYVKVAYIV